ncbi:MAG: septation protein IspZ, partial [Alphaproteobacteria bacterium]|nr:septation protein IspZ [Alphaproteobacteria bacterium]
MNWLRRLYPFNVEQTVNIMSEFGPLVTMFVLNAAYGINVGTWGLIIGTGLSIVAMLAVLGRLPMFPLIASAVTILFGFLTIVTGDPMWVQIKVTIFNAMFAVFLFGGLYL